MDFRIVDNDENKLIYIDKSEMIHEYHELCDNEYTDRFIMSGPWLSQDLPTSSTKWLRIRKYHRVVKDASYSPGREYAHINSSA